LAENLLNGLEPLADGQQREADADHHPGVRAQRGEVVAEHVGQQFLGLLGVGAGL
jgi:hypothetical protein